MRVAATRAAAMGALAALPIVSVDLAASWTWLPQLSDRLELAARLLLLEIPLGALVGAALGVALAFTGDWARRRSADPQVEARLWPLPLALLASPALLAMAYLLFTGGSARRLPMRPALVAATALALLAFTYAGLVAARALVRRATQSRSRLVFRAAVAGFVVAALVALVVNHTVLPGLYDYLHASLAFLAWLALAVAAHLIVGERVVPPRAVAAATAAAMGVLALNLATVSANQSVQLALLSPRASVSRAVMLGLAPLRSAGLEADQEAVEAARQARARRLLEQPVDGVTRPGAHILLITVDALRADHLGAYGYQRRPVSPELDRFAEGAVVFEAAYAQAPHSSFSIGSLMTSDYLLQRTQLGLPVPEATLATQLAAAGYHTAAFYTDGIFHTDGERIAALRDAGFGFARRSHAELGADLKTDEVLGEVDALLAAGEPPSLLWAHYFDVHEPYRRTTFGRSDEERYDSEILRVDEAIMRLVRETRRRFRRPVIVALTADHGEEFRDHGGVYHGSTVYQEQVRVPLILDVPGLAARRVAGPVELVDLAPTLLALVEAQAAPSMHGDDLRGLLEGDDYELGPAFATAGYRHMAVSWPYKLIADLRFGGSELYDLARDPGERRNLADADPARVAELRGEIRAWLDALAEGAANPQLVAIYRGRARDRGAIVDLAALLDDRAADDAMRVEAARLLGRFPSVASRAALARHLEDPSAPVARQSALAAGMLREPLARRHLTPLLRSSDPALRARAALALGRLGDRGAVPALIEALDEARPRRERQEAMHLLGTLRARSAVDALLQLLDDERLRRRAILALGRIGDPRPVPVLIEQLEEQRHSTVRDALARALGQLGDRSVAPSLVRLAVEERLPSAAESLVRIGAVGGAIGGVDVGPALAGADFERCVEQRLDHEWVYTARTTCRTRRANTHIPLVVPSALARGWLLLRARRVDDGRAASVSLRLDGVDLGAATFDSEWSEHRVAVERRGARSRLELRVEDDAVRLEIDHALWLPRSDSALERGEVTAAAR